MRDAVLVDVPDHRADPVGPEGVDVLRGIARGVGPGRIDRVDAAVVLVGEHEDAGVLVVAHAVREPLAGDQPLAQVQARVPDLDPVTGSLARDGAAVLGEIMIVLVAVALTTVPLAHERRPRVTAVDAVVHELQQQRAADDRGRLLAAAVGDAELVRVEVRHGPADRRFRVVRVLRRLGHVDRVAVVLLDLLADQRLVVGEVEAALAVRGIPLVVGIDGRSGLARGHLRRLRERAEVVLHVAVGLAVGGVQLGAELRDVAGDGGRVGIAEDRPVDQVVGALGEGLPTDAVQQQLGGRMPVDRVLGPDAVIEPDLGLGLGLGARRRAAIGLVDEGPARSPRCRSPTCRGSCG